MPASGSQGSRLPRSAAGVTTRQGRRASASGASASSADGNGLGGHGELHLAGPGGSMDDLCRLQYDADGEPAAAHDHKHVHAHRRRADQPTVRQEMGSLALLVLLYMVQGVPLGLTTGAL
jgi:hypothetical protein